MSAYDTTSARQTNGKFSKKQRGKSLITQRPALTNCVLRMLVVQIVCVTPRKDHAKRRSLARLGRQFKAGIQQLT